LNKPSTMRNRTAHWMRQLAFQYEYVRQSHPGDRLMIVFDIDGTIFDTRYMILSVMKAYDSAHNTSYFSSLSAEGISAREDELLQVLDGLDIPLHDHEPILSWCLEKFWRAQSALDSHHPYQGVFDVIRWFQLQPNTFVGVNTGRDGSLRAFTLESLNRAGSEYRVEFPDHLLFMNETGDLLSQKAAGIQYFEDQGYRVFAMVDNEPENLKAIAQSHREKDILLLHASTIFKSLAGSIPEDTAAGMDYDLSELIQEKALPSHVQFVWHGVNDESILRQFLASRVHWAELHVRQEPGTERVVLRRRSFKALPPAPGEKIVSLEDFLSILKHTDRGIKLDIKDAGLLWKVIQLLKDLAFEDDRIWFSASLYKIQKAGLKSLSDAFPGSIRQIPVDFLSPLTVQSPIEFRGYLEMLSRIGFNRFSVNWKTRNCRKIITAIQSSGFDVNIYNVPDLDAFLQAILLMPRSITSYFNFPKWFYYGRNEDNLWLPHDQRKIA
jgi:hypothetical protein